MSDNFRMPHLAPTPAVAAPDQAGSHQVVVGLIMILMILTAGVVVGRQEAVAKAAPAATAAADPVLGAEIKQTKSELEGLHAQLQRLRETVDALPQPAPAPDLKPIQEALDRLAGTIAAATPLLEKVDKLGEHVGAVGKQIDGLGADIVALKKASGTSAQASAK